MLRQTEEMIPNPKGKPGFGIELNPDYAYTFGVSILLDAIGVAVMDFAGNVIATKFSEMDDMSIAHALEAAEALVKALSEECKLDDTRVLGIGVGISGFFSSMDGKMNTHHMLEEWSQVDIVDIISNHFKLPTWVVNDGTGAAAGEEIGRASCRERV